MPSQLPSSLILPNRDNPNGRWDAKYAAFLARIRAGVPLTLDLWVECVRNDKLRGEALAEIKAAMTTSSIYRALCRGLELIHPSPVVAERLMDLAARVKQERIRDLRAAAAVALGDENHD